MPVLPFVNTRQRQFEALVRAHSGELYRYAYWLCGQAALAEDLVQETLLRAWKGLEALREAEAARGWLYTILRREHARLYERVRPGMGELDDEQHAVEAAWADPERQGSDAELREAMLALPPKYREPLLMQVLGGYSCEEIATELGLKANAVMVQLFRARQKLKEALSERSETNHGLS